MIRSQNSIQIGTVTALLGLFLLGRWSVTTAADRLPLTGCASDSAPFVMHAEGKGNSGYSVELLTEIGRLMGRAIVVVDRPWARCLDEVQSKKVDFAVDAYDDPERKKSFLYTASYHTLTPQVFFQSSKESQVGIAGSPTDLTRLKGCGVRGYSYDHYGIDSKFLDLGASDDRQMIRKLIAGRCDYALEELEYIVGHRKHDPDWPAETGLKSFRPLWAKAPKVHLLISRTHPDGEKLRDQINKAIDRLQSDGTAARLRSKYFESGPISARK